MAYSFKPGESIHSAVKRIVEDEIDSAIEQLEGRGEADRDEAIHEARKNVKKIRGVLKLMRPELGSVYTSENARFSELGHRLSEFRDAGAMLEIFDQIRKIYREEWGGKHALASIRKRLMEAKAGHESEAGIADVLASVAHDLGAAHDAVKHWPLQGDGFEAIAPGLELTYRAGRRAMAKAMGQPDLEHFHEWRKRVKDHWYHIRLLGQVCGDSLAFYQKDLKDLETCLGDDHNLAVLQLKVQAERESYGPASDVEVFLGTVEKYQASLRSSASSLGQVIYEDKPKVFVGQIRSLWEAWSKDRERIYSSLPATG